MINSVQTDAEIAGLGRKLSEKFDAIIVVGLIRHRSQWRNTTLKTLNILGLLSAENIMSGKVII